MKLKYFHKKDIGGFLIDRLALALEANETFQKEFHICSPSVLLCKGGEPRSGGGFMEGWYEVPEDLSHETQNPSSASADTSPFLKGRQNSKLVISFVPTHRYRHYFVKGYNQSQLLAQKLSEKLQVPLVDIAKKKKHTKTQASLDRNGRLKNLKNAFSLTQNLTLLGNETILIVDDITTT